MNLNRRQFLAVGTVGLGILAGCASQADSSADTPTTTTPATDPPLTLLTAEQVVEDGVNQAKTRLVFAVPDGVTVDAAQLAGCVEVRTNVRDPVDDRVKPRQVPVSDVAVGEDGIEVIVNGPVSDDSEVAVSSGLSPVPATTTLQTGTTPTEAALWFKAYEPTERSKHNFARRVYNSSITDQIIPQSDNPVVVRSELQQHLQRKINNGTLTATDVNETLALYDDPTKRELFTHNGKFEPQLIAAALALNGTVGESALDIIFEGQNQSNKPVKVFFTGDLTQSSTAEVLFENGEMHIRFSTSLQDEPFESLSSVLAHETVHLDRTRGQNEEVIAENIEANVHAQQLLANSQLASVRTNLNRSANSELMSVLNSGKAGHPNPGIKTSIQKQNAPRIFPGTNRDWESNEELVREVFYPNLPDNTTPGNEYTDQAIAKITGLEDRPNTIDYDLSRNTVDLMDNQTMLDSEQKFQLLQILGLKLAE